jgi:succinate dehydrogenase / fumarate reductase cytochrome b subunit
MPEDTTRTYPPGGLTSGAKPFIKRRKIAPIEENPVSQIHENRPLSPHLGIYRWQISNTLSILHRMTGFGLTLGLIPLSLWLWGAAYNPELYSWLQWAFSSLLGKLALFGWTLAFYYHLGNGIRHLNWDLGRGFGLNEMLQSGRLVIVFALSLTVFTWAYVYNNAGVL